MNEQEEKQKNENEHTYDNGFHPKEVTLKDNYRFYNRTFIFLLMQTITLFFGKIIFYILKKFMVGFKIKGRKNFTKLPKGSVIIANHIHQLDAFFIVSEFMFKKVYISVLQSNLGFPFFSRFIRFAGAVPIPDNRKQLEKFDKETIDILQNKHKTLLIYAEAALNPYCYHIRDFKKGAFHFAVSADVSIVPMVYTFHKSKFRKKPRIQLNVLPPYYIKHCETKRETINQTLDEVQTIMRDFYNKTSEFHD